MGVLSASVEQAGSLIARGACVVVPVVVAVVGVVVAPSA
jgi:hypothetical protein